MPPHPLRERGRLNSRKHQTKHSHNHNSDKHNSSELSDMLGGCGRTGSGLDDGEPDNNKRGSEYDSGE